MSLFRASTKPKDVRINPSDFVHEYDPIGSTMDALADCTLIKSFAVNLSFAINEITSFVGYIESTLALESSSCFSCSKNDVEQLFLISLPTKWKHSYTLQSFTTDIEINSYRSDMSYCATLFVFDCDTLRQGTEEILWQSAIMNKDTTEKSRFVARKRGLNAPKVLVSRRCSRACPQPRSAFGVRVPPDASAPSPRPTQRPGYCPHPRRPEPRSHHAACR